MELKKHQEPLSVGQQIKNLKALNLLIEDEAAAVKFLNNVSYYRFIKAYSLGLKPKNGTYHDGVTFDQLMELYLFNSDFRHLLFPLIESVEINLRCRVSNYFCNTYGVLVIKNLEILQMRHTMLHSCAMLSRKHSATKMPHSLKTFSIITKMETSHFMRW